MTRQAPHFGELLRTWRQRRRLSQLALSLESGVSQRHISFVESGRATPSRELVMRLAQHLSVPMRERNTLLVAAGFAPVYRERALDEPELGAARVAMAQILRGHEPHPAIAVDRHWNLVSANRMFGFLVGGVDPALLKPPINVLRCSLHPRGLGPRMLNYAQWHAHVLERLAELAEHTGDSTFTDLIAELRTYPEPAEPAPPAAPAASIAVPFRLRLDDGTALSFITTTTVFGTAVDITLSELTIETMFPTDAETVAAMRALWETLPAT